MTDKTLVQMLQKVNDADLWSDKTCQIVDAAFETVSRNPSDHDEAVAYRRALAYLQSRIETLEAALREICQPANVMNAIPIAQQALLADALESQP